MEDIVFMSGRILIEDLRSAGLSPEQILLVLQAVEARQRLAWRDRKRGQRGGGGGGVSRKSRVSLDSGGQAGQVRQGSRLLPDWRPGAGDAAFAEARLGGRWHEEFGKFRDYWLALDDPRRAVKRDWGAAFRSWVRKAVEYGLRGDVNDRWKERKLDDRARFEAAMRKLNPDRERSGGDDVEVLPEHSDWRH